MKTKRFISIALAIILTFSLVPMTTTVSAADSVTVKFLVEPSLDFDYLGTFNDGLLRVVKNDKYGFIDKTGKVVIPLEYDLATDFSEGLSIVMKGTWEDGKYGVIDKTGKIVVPIGEYDRISVSATWKGFSEGLASVSKDGKYGFIDKTGKLVIPFDYNYELLSGADYFSEGLVAAIVYGENFFNGDNSDFKAGFIDKMGKFVFTTEYNLFESVFSDGLAKVGDRANDYLYGYIDKTGKLVIPSEYNWVLPFSEGLAVVAKGSYPNWEYGVIDKTGKLIVPINSYDYMNSFSEGLAVVMNGTWENGKWGFIDKTGRMVIPLEYESAGSFSDGLANVGKNGKHGFVDKAGKIVVPLEYDSVYAFSEGLAAVKKGSKWGILGITTSASSEPEAKPEPKPEKEDESSPYKVGDPLGDVLYSDITAYINGQAIPTSVINGKTLVVVEDLAKYGFDVKWNGTEKTLNVELNKGKAFNPMATKKDTSNTPGTFKEKYVYTDIKTYISGEEVECYAIKGVTLIDFDALGKFGTFKWDGAVREIKLTVD